MADFELVHEELMPKLEEMKTRKPIPQFIKSRLSSLKSTIALYDKSVVKNEPSESLKRSAQNQSALLYDHISAFLTTDMPEEETPNQNNNTMTKEEKELADRAEKVGLPATATVAEIETKEAEQKEAEKLKKRALACGLAETATLGEIETKEKQDQDAKDLAARAKKAGLPETATLAEVEAKENDKGTKKDPDKKDDTPPPPPPDDKKKKESSGDALSTLMCD